MSISIIFPIELDNPGSGQGTDRFGMQSFSDSSPVAAIKQNLKMLLLTRQGEYVMDNNYGVGLPDYLFLQEQEVDTSGLESVISSQAATYMPYMTISNLSVTLDPLNSMMRIKIEFFYNELTIPEVFELEVI
jgi:phage baseplate assembly protein W